MAKDDSTLGLWDFALGVRRLRRFVSAVGSGLLHLHLVLFELSLPRVGSVALCV